MFQHANSFLIISFWLKFTYTLHLAEGGLVPYDGFNTQVLNGEGTVGGYLNPKEEGWDACFNEGSSNFETCRGILGSGLVQSKDYKYSIAAFPQQKIDFLRKPESFLQTIEAVSKREASEYSSRGKKRAKTKGKHAKRKTRGERNEKPKAAGLRRMMEAVRNLFSTKSLTAKAEEDAALDHMCSQKENMHCQGSNTSEVSILFPPSRLSGLHSSNSTGKGHEEGPPHLQKVEQEEAGGSAPLRILHQVIESGIWSAVSGEGQVFSWRKWKCAIVVKKHDSLGCIIANLHLPLSHPVFTKIKKSVDGVEYRELFVPEIPNIKQEHFSPENRWNYITTLGHLVAPQATLERPPSASTSVGTLTNVKVTKFIEKKRLKAQSTKTKPSTGDKLFWAAYHLRLAQLTLPPSVDAVLLRLLLAFISFKQCKKSKAAKERVTLTTEHGSFHPSQKRIRRKLLAHSLVDSLQLSTCPGSANCSIITEYAGLQATVDEYFLKFNKLNLPTSSEQLYMGGKLLEATPEAVERIKNDIYTDLQESIVFISTMAGSLKTKVINLVASSKASRLLISSLAKPVIAFTMKHQQRQPAVPAVQTGTKAQATSLAVEHAHPEALGAEVEGRKARAKATAVVMSAERGSFAFAATGMRAFSSLEEKLVRTAIKARVKRMFKRPSKTQRKSKTRSGKKRRKSKAKPKHSLSKKRRNGNIKHKKIRNKKYSFVEDYGAVLIPNTLVNSSTVTPYRHGSARDVVRSFSSLLRHTDRNASALNFLQTITEENQKKNTSKRIIIGGAFLLLGFTAVNTMVPGAFVVFLIIAGAVMLLLPLLKKLVSLVGGGGIGSEEGSATKTQWGAEEGDEEEGVAFEHEMGLRSEASSAEEHEEE